MWIRHLPRELLFKAPSFTPGNTPGEFKLFGAEQDYRKTFPIPTSNITRINIPCIIYAQRKCWLHTLSSRAQKHKGAVSAARAQPWTLIQLLELAVIVVSLGMDHKKSHGGWWGILELHDFFFLLTFSLYKFFRLLHEYFLGLSCMHEFFPLNYPLH